MTPQTWLAIVASLFGGASSTELIRGWYARRKTDAETKSIEATSHLTQASAAESAAKAQLTIGEAWIAYVSRLEERMAAAQHEHDRRMDAMQIEHETEINRLRVAVETLRAENVTLREEIAGIRA